MQPKLQEDPREWRRFTTASAVAIGLIAGLAQWRDMLPMPFWGAIGGCVALAFLSWVRPDWFRGFYRVGMTVGFWLGQFVGRLLLLVIFLVVLTPLAGLLRLMGKDLLGLKRRSGASTYWKKPRSEIHLDRQF